MNTENIILLTEEVSRLDREIEKLIRQQEACQNGIVVYSGFVNESDLPPAVNGFKKPVFETCKVKNIRPVKSDKPKNKYYTPRPKNQPAGTMKFCDYLLKIFSSKPDKKFTTKEAAVIMGKAVSDNKIFPVPAKDLQSNTTAYLWYHTKRGQLIKEEVEGGKNAYQFSGNAQEKKSKISQESNISSKSLEPILVTGKLDDAILDIIRKERRISLPNLVLKIQRHEDYLEISKNLTGTLAKCTEEILRDLVAREILEWTDNNEYQIDKAGDL